MMVLPGPKDHRIKKERIMAKGEATYSSADKKVVRFENKPIPKGDYELVLLEKGLEVRRSKEKGPDAIPYIGCRFGVQGTEAKEGGKPRLVFVNFFLSLKPGADGIVMPERQGGIVEFLRANGKELEGVGIKTLTKEDGSTEQYLDAEAIVEMLKEMSDTATSAHVTIEPGRDPKGSDDRNKVSYWGAKDDESEEPAKEEEKPAGKKTLPKKK